jgi:hypothetical protein
VTLLLLTARVNGPDSAKSTSKKGSVHLQHACPAITGHTQRWNCGAGILELVKDEQGDFQNTPNTGGLSEIPLQEAPRSRSKEGPTEER